MNLNKEFLSSSWLEINHLVDGLISLHAPCERAGHRNCLADMDLRVARLPHHHLHGTLVRNVLTDVEETLKGIIHGHLVHEKFALNFKENLRKLINNKFQMS